MIRRALARMLRFFADCVDPSSADADTARTYITLDEADRVLEVHAGHPATFQTGFQERQLVPGDVLVLQFGSQQPATRVLH